MKYVYLWDPIMPGILNLMLNPALPEYRESFTSYLTGNIPETIITKLI